MNQREDKKKRGLFDRMIDIDRRIIYLSVIVVFFIPYIQPIGLPIPITKNTIEMYDIIESLPEGSIVVVATNTGVNKYPEIGPGWVALTKHLFERNVKVLFWGIHEEAGFVSGLILDSFNFEKEYGVDYARFGWIPGLEVGIAAVADDMHGVLSTDIFGTKIESLPIMDDVKTAADVDLLVCGSTSNEHDLYVKHWVSAYGTRMVVNTIGLSLSNVIPFYDAGQVEAYLNGQMGGAEYEVKTKSPGEGVKALDVQSLGHLIVLLYIVLGNISALVNKGRIQ